MTTPWPRTRGFVPATAFALALSLLPAATAAQSAPAKKAAAKKPAPAEATALDAAPAPREEMTTSESSRASPFGVGLFLGPSFEGSTAAKIRVEGTMALAQLSPRMSLELVLPAALAFWSQDQIPGLVGQPPYRASSVRFELVPSARLLLSLSREISLYGDGGLGFGYYHASLENVPVGTPVPTTSTDATAVFRLAAGGSYALGDQFRFLVEPVGLNFYFGSGGSTFVYSLLLGASYRF
jgi:hypothetical protein